MGCKGCPQMAGKRLDPSAINRDRLRTLIAWMVSAEPLLSLMKAIPGQRVTIDLAQAQRIASRMKSQLKEADALIAALPAASAFSATAAHSCAKYSSLIVIGVVDISRCAVQGAGASGESTVLEPRLLQFIKIRSNKHGYNLSCQLRRLLSTARGEITRQVDTKVFL